MLYEAYQAHVDVMGPFRVMAQATGAFLKQPWPGLNDNVMVRAMAAACELVVRSGMSHSRPAFGIDTVRVGGREVAVTEENVLQTPFGNLLHFAKDGSEEQPRVLLVAPMSGHFATLLRGTVKTLLPDNDVYITDWKNARNVSLIHGRFDLDDFIDTITGFMNFLGPRNHVIAVCQPAVPVFAAVSLMAADGAPNQPATMTLMGGPIDTRINPTQVNVLATTRDIDWFERNVVTSVPLRYPGAFRRVYPGFLQLAGFMTMNLDRHVNAHVDLFHHLVKGDGESAEATQKFYDEYTAVMDLPAEFYLQTIREVFQEHALPLGRLVSRGRKVEPRAIKRTALLTVEGEKDDICAVGQTSAAQDLCTGLAASKKAHHLQRQVGHYGVFNGRRWSTEIYPVVRDFIRSHG
ncbi:poly(3-hydroxybutyrate) depolymerase [Aliidongia dinghuensis]|uniref:Poly(3-hydroxybutyrate) depolymerase n=1 Tax=Aliidongia dinghuensis TaxID=1867774 RepID=A0A8J2YUW3_9PROT|nr:polyhydroxyalkanoate depolymerase [Aliidongia dinghuensis]GGF25366.1 poly(3-hydroxybutyrate) depolymerase [Aliidongia dinghuensis]